MKKILYSILLSILFVAPAWAQQSGCNSKKDGVVFAPKKGQWQVSLMLGNSGQMYKDDNQFLLPHVSNTGGSIGLPNGSSNNSGYLRQYLNINGQTDNSLTNMLGIQVKYFVSDCWDINFSLGMDISATPKKDFVQGDYESVADMIIPEQKYINAQTSNNWFVNIGADRYFKTSNPRIHPYIGVTAGFQMARVDAKEPYVGTYADGEDDFDDIQDSELEGLDKHVYYAAGKVGQMFAIKGGFVAGIEYSLAKGLILGLECQPLAYRYDVIQIQAQGFDKYTASHHNIKIIEMPVVKLGFRF